MNLSALFVARPIATTLLTVGILLAGVFGYRLLPVSPLPQVDFPTIAVQAQQPGASPDTMATSVAAPLERHLGQIADVTEMTSSSTPGQTRITMQFDLNRDIDGAARDVQAAIQAARVDLPSSLRQNPTYHKVNPSDAPILILALTSTTLTRGQIYDNAYTIMQQTLSQVAGVGEVDIYGASLPAVRVELNPGALFKYGIGLEDVRAALASANANAPKGSIEDSAYRYQIYTNDQATRAADYQDLVIAYRNGAAVRLRDIADVQDSVEDLRNAGRYNGVNAVLGVVFRQPGANIIQTVDGVLAALPRVKASLHGGIDIAIAGDRTTTIRGSLRDTQATLVISVALVTFVVFVFLRDWRATLIPAIAVPVSIIGTFGAMYLLGYSLDNLSLMALTISTGFVVDDAIVVLENIARHVEAGMPRMQATLLGAKEIGFTVLSITVSLVAVFLPILLMGGIVGRLFHEFAITLSLAISISLVISLTTTPMLCARLLRRDRGGHGRLYLAVERAFALLLRGYERTLDWSLRHRRIVAGSLVATVAFNVLLVVIIPKGFFPQQDTGLMQGSIQADQSISFQAMEKKLNQFMALVTSDPAVAGATGFTGGRSINSGFLYISLKPIAERKVSADDVIARLRPKMSSIPGARMFIQSSQDIRIGGRQSNSQYQYTLQADSTAELYEWGPKLVTALQASPVLTDVNSDQQQHGLETMLHIDRTTAARLGVTPSMIDNTLYDAFGQRQVSTIYNALNQYHVVMEVAPEYWQDPQTLRDMWVSTSGGNAAGSQTTNAPAGTTVASTTASTAASATTRAQSVALDAARNQAVNSIAASGKSSASSGASVSNYRETMIPFAAFSGFSPSTTPLSVNHQGQFVSATLSFNLAQGKSLSDAVAAIRQAEAAIHMPATIHGMFGGAAATFQQSLDTEPLLFAAAILTVYIVLGVLYESYIHPITILSTLPSAFVGGLLALMLLGQQATIIALIGIILLIGIVKKNAIMMIDFALHAERDQGMDRYEAIRAACLLRFRPILMTTAAAMLGALPLALGTGDGAELRQPLGIEIVGGLMVSQVLTLYTTPVVYLYLDKWGAWAARRFGRGARRIPPAAVPEPGE